MIWILLLTKLYGHWQEQPFQQECSTIYFVFLQFRTLYFIVRKLLTEATFWTVGNNFVLIRLYWNIKKAREHSSSTFLITLFETLIEPYSDIVPLHEATEQNRTELSVECRTKSNRGGGGEL